MPFFFSFRPFYKSSLLVQEHNLSETHHVLIDRSVHIWDRRRTRASSGRLEDLRGITQVQRKKKNNKLQGHQNVPADRLLFGKVEK